MPKRIPQISLKSDYIPTRFDDIKREIHLEKYQKYFQQQETSQVIENKTVQLGKIINDKAKELLKGFPKP